MKERSYSKNRISSISFSTLINLWIVMPIPLGKKQIKVSTRLLVMKIFKKLASESPESPESPEPQVGPLPTSGGKE
jgi:hypothetical protein